MPTSHSSIQSRVQTLRSGPIGDHAEAFAARLTGVGYRLSTINRYLSAAVHFAAWLQTRHVHFEDADDETIIALRRRFRSDPLAVP